jgi:hypothetical protein
VLWLHLTFQSFWCLWVQVCIWCNSCATVGGLASDACGAHWVPPQGFIFWSLILLTLQDEDAKTLKLKHCYEVADVFLHFAVPIPHNVYISCMWALTNGFAATWVFQLLTSNWYAPEQSSSGRRSGSQRGGCKGGWAAWDLDINTYVQTVGRSYHVRLLRTWEKGLLRTWVKGILNGVEKYGKVQIAVSQRHKRTTRKVTLLQVKLCLVMVFGKCRLEAWDKAFQCYWSFLGGQASSNAMLRISDWEVAKQHWSRMAAVVTHCCQFFEIPSVCCPMYHPTPLHSDEWLCTTEWHSWGLGILWPPASLQKKLTSMACTKQS